MTPSGIQVPGFGPKDAKIVVVGEAPGENEVQQGRPFVGASGNLLQNTLRKMGVSPSEVYFTNVVKVRPAYNNFDVFYLDGPKRFVPSELLLKSYSDLRKELLELHPNVIIPVGGEPFKALLGNRPGGISSWRGSILKSDYGKLVGTYHPSYILRSYGDLPIFEHDIRRAVEESKTPGLYLPIPRMVIEPSFSQVISYLQKRPSKLAFDIETTFGTFVRCISFAHSPLDSICIPFMGFRNQSKPISSSGLVNMSPTSSTMTSWWTEEEEMAILKEMNNLFLDQRVEKTGQNGQFDMSVLSEQFGLEVRNYSFDTMLGHHTCYAELPKALDFLVSLYTRIPYYSGYEPSNDHSTWVYCSWDSIGTFQVAERVVEELKDMNLLDYYREQRHLPMFAYTRAQNRGVLVDEVERQRQKKTLQDEIKSLETIISKKVGIENFNPSSPKQVAAYLYETLKLKPVLHHKTKKPTADKNAMETLSYSNPEHKEFFDALRTHGSKENILQGFFNLSLPRTRIFTSYNVAGTVTGRLNSSHTFLHPNDSTNLQNIQKPGSGNTRRCFISDSGKTLIKADLSQAEWRLVLGYGRILRILEKYRENPEFDVHRWVASIIYSKAEREISKPERDVAKNGVYGGNYMMGDLTAARTYHLPFQTAKFVLSSYRRAVPEIPLWWEEVKRELADGRIIENCFGSKRIFLGRLDDEMLRAALSHKPQSTVGDIINRAASIADNLFPPEECQLLLQAHDELVFQSPPEFVPKYVPIIRNLLEIPLTMPGLEEKLIIPADVAVGPNWLDCKVVK